MQEHDDQPGWQNMAPDVAFEFDNDPCAPRAARQALLPLLVEDGRFAENVSLVASELVSNVVMHTGRGGQFRAWNDNPLRIEVRDFDPALPTRPRPSNAGPADLGGRGLAIIGTVADRWGAQIDDAGKTLWAEFHRPR